jgi:hypothetical protein
MKYSLIFFHTVSLKKMVYTSFHLIAFVHKLFMAILQKVSFCNFIHNHHLSFVYIWKKLVFAISLFFLNSALFAQYASFDVVPVHTISSGLASEGLAIQDPLLNLSSNPSFLAGSLEPVLDFGITVPFQGNQSAALKPSHFGGYYPLDSISGIGLRGRNLYHSSFPHESRSNYFQTQIFYSRLFNQMFYSSIGVGPGVGWRGGEQSNLTLSPFISLGFKWKQFLFGFSAQSPGGVYRYNNYRSGDELKERLPPSLGIGLSYKLSTNLEVTSELRRVFYERSAFTLNGEDAKPKFDRGLGADLKLSVGLSLAIRDDSVWKIRTGLELAGKYDETGKNRRGTGLGFGFGYSPNPNEKGFQFNFSVLDYSLFSPKNGYPSETLFFTSLGYLY